MAVAKLDKSNAAVDVGQLLVTVTCDIDCGVAVSSLRRVAIKFSLAEWSTLGKNERTNKKDVVSALFPALISIERRKVLLIHIRNDMRCGYTLSRIEMKTQRIGLFDILKQRLHQQNGSAVEQLPEIRTFFPTQRRCSVKIPQALAHRFSIPGDKWFNIMKWTKARKSILSQNYPSGLNSEPNSHPNFLPIENMIWKRFGHDSSVFSSVPSIPFWQVININRPKLRSRLLTTLYLIQRWTVNNRPANVKLERFHDQLMQLFLGNVNCFWIQ